MRKFPTLLIDDDQNERNNSSVHMKEHEYVQFVPCGEIDESNRFKDDTVYHLYFGFYLLAILDLKIGDDIDAGVSFARIIMKHQPLCERILYSHVIGEDKTANADELDRYFGSASSFFDSFIRKGNVPSLRKFVLQKSILNGYSFTNEESTFAQAVPEISFKCGESDRRLCAWATSIVEEVAKPSLTGKSLADKFQIKDTGKAIAIMFQSLESEIDFLVSRVLGQGLHKNKPSPVDKLTLTPLDEGKSSSLVLMGQPKIKGFDSKVWLVFKIDLKERILTELHGFDNYIKFLVSRGRRVEVIGHAVGNRLGTICYTFVGANPEKPVTLKTRFDLCMKRSSDKNLTSFEDFIKKLFSERDLHEVHTGLNTDIRTFSATRLSDSETKFDLDTKWKKIADDITKLFENKHIHTTVPLGVTDATVIGIPHPQCWSHGDLHLSNIVLGDGDDLILIDFRDTGPAPQVWDFMTLTTSIRLEASKFLTNYKKETIEKFFEDEEQLLNEILAPNTEPSSLDENITKNWRPLLICIIQWMKKTFPDSSSDESQRERLQDQFIACSFAWGCYLFDKVEKESSQLGLDKTAATKVERKLVYLALYLCFLGKKMVDKNR